MFTLEDVCDQLADRSADSTFLSRVFATADKAAQATALLSSCFACCQRVTKIYTMILTLI